MVNRFDEEETPEQEFDLLTVGDVARILRVDLTTVRRWITNGSLDAVILPHSGNRKSYRIKRSVLNDLLEGKTA